MTQRALWNQRRRRVGLHRPSPLNVVVVNCMSVSAPARRAKRILANAAAYGDVILGCECADFHALTELGSDWWTWQDTTSPATAGSVVALRRTRGDLTGPGLSIGVRRERGDSIRDRHLATARLLIDPGTPRVWSLDALAGHAPPKRDWDRWPAFMRSVRATNADIDGADWNKPGRAVARALGRRVLSVGIVGLAVRRWIPTSKPIPLDVGGDHRAVLVTLWPSK